MSKKKPFHGWIRVTSIKATPQHAFGNYAIMFDKKRKSETKWISFTDTGYRIRGKDEMDAYVRFIEEVAELGYEVIA